MANVFLDLPVPAADGVGAAVDTSTMGGEKTITVRGQYSGTLIIEISNEGPNGPWAQPLVFAGPLAKRVVKLAARFMRVRRTGVRPLIGGVPNVDVASNDNGGLFRDLPPGNPGVGIDVSDMGGFKTVIVSNLKGVLYVEVSEDGVDWVQCFTFATGPTEQKSKLVYAKFMRARGAVADIDVGAINDASPGTPITFGAPITVRGPTNAEGASPDAARADHDHRLEYEVEDEGILVSARPRMNFVGDGVGAVDIPGEDKTEVTIPGPNLGDGGAVVKRSLYVPINVSTSGTVFVDAMSGGVVTVPIDGDYWAFYEGEGDNQSASGILEIGISVNSVVAVVAGSERRSQGSVSDARWIGTTVQLPGLTAGDLIRGLFRKVAGAGSVRLGVKHLSILKVQ